MAGGKRGPADSGEEEVARVANPRMASTKSRRGRSLARFLRSGIYLAQLYGEISTMIEQRVAALTSAIYSAPHPIRAGDDVERSGLLDRLTHLAIRKCPAPMRPENIRRRRAPSRTTSARSGSARKVTRRN